VSDAPIARFEIGEYYSPMYDTRELAEQRHRLWPAQPREVVGIDWNEARQIELCRDVFAQQSHTAFPVDDVEPDGALYFTNNDQYPPLDAWLLAGIMRHLRPQKMVEVGCGFSTLVGAQVNRESFQAQIDLVCIEPYPRSFLLAGIEGVSEIRIEKVQETPLSIFESLGKNDILFIDTSHTVKTGGDVVWIFQEILPRLAPGVVVHIHDFFVPGEYPESWVLEGWGWNETYLVRSFLTFNNAFEILWATQYMLANHLDELLSTFPELGRCLTQGGASLWIRRG
jgi:predicted O-methyltransferase YrrM